MKYFSLKRLCPIGLAIIGLIPMVGVASNNHVLNNLLGIVGTFQCNEVVNNIPCACTIQFRLDGSTSEVTTLAMSQPIGTAIPQGLYGSPFLGNWKPLGNGRFSAKSADVVNFKNTDTFLTGTPSLRVVNAATYVFGSDNSTMTFTGTQSLYNVTDINLSGFPAPSLPPGFPTVLPISGTCVRLSNP